MATTPQNDPMAEHVRELGIIIAAAMKTCTDIHNQNMTVLQKGGQLMHPIDFKQRFAQSYGELKLAFAQIDHPGASELGGGPRFRSALAKWSY